jgi:hypothetical protein
MSVLETPRIYFKGQVTWDPITSNNYNFNYDEDTGETIYPSVIDKVKKFRAQAITQVGTQGNWNPHGTHRVTFLIRQFVASMLVPAQTPTITS